MTEYEKYKIESKKIDIKYGKDFTRIKEDIIVERGKYIIKKSRIKEKYDDKNKGLESLLDNI